MKKFSKEREEIPLPASYEAPPRVLNKTRSLNGRLYVAGEGIYNCDVMFITTAVTDEEAATEFESDWGTVVKMNPGYLRGPAGTTIKDIMTEYGIDPGRCYVTSLIKWLLPKQYRSRPRALDIRHGAELLRQEILDVKPKLIVTFGKPAFTFVTGYKFALRHIAGGFLDSKEFGVPVFPMEDPYKLISQPEYLERFHVDFREVRGFLAMMRGEAPPRIEQNYQVINDSSELEALVLEWKANDYKLFSVDCEWHGANHVDGDLRSIQFCWAPGQACYVRFMDDQLNYVFDATYSEVGRILGEHLNKPEVKYIGHHFAADAPWMDHWLGLEWYDKCVMDTEFGMQTIDENAELALERLCMPYTDLGRWDLELTLWTKENKALVEDGYGYVPDEILIPYSMCDVDGPFRTMPFIIKEMTDQNLLIYFYQIFLPFVTNVFTQFAITGLPASQRRMDDLRELFNFVRFHMEKDFRESIHTEAYSFMFNLLNTLYPGGEGLVAFVAIKNALDEGDRDTAFDVFKAIVDAGGIAEHCPKFEHLAESSEFNIRSVDHMRRWLFQVKGLTPVKSVASRAKGIPAMDWEKVMELPPSRRTELSPSVDKQSLEIFEQSGDNMITKLLQFNAVGNLCKAFLKSADVDPDTGDLVKENGLHYWLASDGRIHGQTSTTETGRPRSWKPNILNWPSWINKKIADGMASMLSKLKERDELPEQFDKFVDVKNIPSIRSCVDVTDIPPLPGSEGWCLVESDYATAEIRGLAFISGDENLIRLMTEPDEDFAIWKDAPDEDYGPVRLSYSAESGISPANCNPHLIRRRAMPLPKGIDVSEEEATALPEKYLVTNEGKVLELKILGDDDFVKNEDGTIKHPSHDLHWSLSEMTFGMPREYLNKKKDRGGAKVGNFSSAYGATDTTIERKIESDTGTKPEKGTGRRILDALARRQPIATAFLEEVAEAPKEKGFLVAASGRRRHFFTHPDAMSVDWRTRKSKLASLGREARNFFMQESVASTAARAGNWLLDFFRRFDLQARPMTILYDSVVTLCPVEERFLVAEAHRIMMCDVNKWHYHGRDMNYPIDCEFNMAWSWKPSKEQREKLMDRNWAPETENLKPAYKFLERVLDLDSYPKAVKETN